MRIQTTPLKIGDINTNEITIENSYKMKISFLTYCGIITNLEVPDVNGNFGNIVARPKDNLEYLNSIKYGNISMITSDKSSLIDNKEYIQINDSNFLSSENYLEYNYQTDRDKDNNDALYAILQSDIVDEDGYKTSKSIQYTLDEENNFSIKYEVVSDKRLSLNIFNNFNFNLSIEDTQNILEHKIRMPSKHFYQIYKQDANIRRLSVENTPFDFSNLKSISDGINSNYGRIHKDEVYNTIFELNSEDISPTISIYDENSKRLLNITTDSTHIFMSSNNSLNKKEENLEQYNKSITMRFYDLILNDKWKKLEFPVIEPKKSYSKFVNYNFKLM